MPMAPASMEVTAQCTCQSRRYTIRTSSLKFIGLPVPKMWPLFGNGVNRPGDLDLSTSKWDHG